MSSKIKYQIFVSSTYEDLKEERALVIKAILEMGHIPVGMEMFSAGDEEQWKQIKRQIDDSDYYVVIVAHRYGSMDKDISYTEKEYDYAIQNGIPTLGFVIDEKVEWSKDKCDTTNLKKKKLVTFKSKIKQKLVSFWVNKDDLSTKVSIALVKQFNTTPREGWIKSNQVTSPELVNELSRLSSENANLRDENEELKRNIELEKELKLKNLIMALQNENNQVEITYQYKTERGWKNPTKYSLYVLFLVIAPEIMVEKSINDIVNYVGIITNPKKEEVEKLHETYPIPSNLMKQILADLSVLDLVEPSKKKHSVHDKNQYWAITDVGKNIYKMIKRAQLMSESDVAVSHNAKVSGFGLEL